MTVFNPTKVTPKIFNWVHALKRKQPGLKRESIVKMVGGQVGASTVSNILRVTDYQSYCEWMALVTRERKLREENNELRSKLDKVEWKKALKHARRDYWLRVAVIAVFLGFWLVAGLVIWFFIEGRAQ